MRERNEIGLIYFSLGDLTDLRFRYVTHVTSGMTSKLP